MQLLSDKVLDLQEILPVKGMHVEAIEEIIRRRTDALEFEAEIAEMKANPVTGPVSFILSLDASIALVCDVLRDIVKMVRCRTFNRSR